MGIGLGQRITKLAICAAWLGLAAPAWASSQNFQFVAQASDLQVLTYEAPGQPGILRTNGGLRLFDAATGAFVFPAYQLQPGDHLSGTVTLDAPLSVPAGGELQHFGLMLGMQSTSGVIVFYEGRLEVFHQGQAVVPGGSFGLYAGTSGAVGPGGYSTTLPFPGFSFDAVRFDILVTDIRQGSVPVAAVNILSDQYQLNFQLATPVPEPAMPLLMLGGLLAGWSCRRLGSKS